MPNSLGITIPAAVAERAFTKWEPSPSGCRISTYSIASHGYAQIGWTEESGKRRGTTAHRAAWTHVHGQIAAGITIDHEPTCDHRCVNVDHLRELTNFENGRRTTKRDWPLGECARGHSNELLIKQWDKSENRYRLRCSECLKIDGKTSRDRINADPVKRERNRLARKRSMDKLKADPVRYEKYLANARERQRQKRLTQ